LGEQIGTGYAKFQLALIESAQAEFMPSFEENRGPLSEVFNNTIFNRSGPKSLVRELTPSEQYFCIVFQGFIEVAKSLETLEDIALYIRRFPFEGAQGSRDRYLQFMVESHFAEAYVLRERLNAYLAKIRRQFKHDVRIPTICDAFRLLADCVNKSLSGVIGVRSRHVHEVRFSDSEIDRLATLALLSHNSNVDFANLMKGYYREVHRGVRRRWRTKIEENNKAIRKLLDIFFDVLYPILFDARTKTLNRPIVPVPNEGKARPSA
jgi:hypothetical protein